jgi:methyl-accepting chemotaxis protein
MSVRDAASADETTGREAIGTATARVHEIVEALNGGDAALGRFDDAWQIVALAADGFARSARQAGVLAINASIEAAAIDDGAGFVIVAERMRALSTTTQETARDLEGIALRSRAAVATTRAATLRTRDAMVAIETLLAAVPVAGDERAEMVRRALASVAVAQGYGAEVDLGVHQMLGATDQVETLVNRVADVAGDAQLLAINAAIEAARAGERGLGFTVIADGIATLSRETGESSETVVRSVVKLRERTQRLGAGSTRQGEALAVVVALLDGALA